jgi:hypothetical protein
MVTAVVNGRLEVVSVTIDPAVLAEPDREMLQDSGGRGGERGDPGGAADDGGGDGES